MGEKLSDLTTKRVITIVLSILFSIPIFALETYREDNVSLDNGLQIIDFWRQSNNDNLTRALFAGYLDLHKDLRNPVIFVSANISKDCCSFPENSSLEIVIRKMRKADYQYYSYASEKYVLSFLIGVFRAIFSTR